MSAALVRATGAILALAVCAPASAGAQAWIKPAGSGYAEVTWRQIGGDQFFDRSGDLREIRGYTQQTLAYFAQVGLIDRWLQVTLSGEAFRWNRLEDRGSTSGAGDQQLGLWTGLDQEGAFVLSAGLIAGLPTGDESPDAALSAGPQVDLIAESLPTGDGEFDLTPSVAAGGSFGGGSWPLRHFASASLGYQLRTQGFSDAVAYRAEIGAGHSALPQAWLIAFIGGVEPLSGPSENSLVGLGDGVTYTAFGLTALATVWRGLGVTASAEGAFRAKNVIAGLAVKAGLNAQF